MANTIRSIIGVAESLSELFGKRGQGAESDQPPNIEDLNTDDLMRERIRLEQEEKKLLQAVEKLERDKRALFEQATQEPSVRKQKIMARKIKELEVKAQNVDRNLRVVSQQLRIINGFVQVKENKRIWEQSGLWAHISQMDLSELEAYVGDALIEGSFNTEKFGDIIGTLEGSRGLAADMDEDPDVLDILKEIQGAAVARETDPTAVDERFEQMEERLRQRQEEPFEETF